MLIQTLRTFGQQYFATQENTTFHADQSVGHLVISHLGKRGISRGEFELVVKRSSSYFTIIVIQIAIYIVNKT